MFFYHLIDGFFLGGVYVAIALGLTLVFGVMNMVNLAQGEFLIGAAYLSFLVVTHTHLDPLLSLIIVVPAMFVIAYVVQRVLLNPLIKRGQETLLVATFGLSLIAQTVFALVFGNNTLALNAPYTLTGITIFGDTVRTVYVIALLAAVLGGILIGVLEEVTASIVGAQYRDLIVFAFLVLILIIRPEGLFGQKVSVAK